MDERYNEMVKLVFYNLYAGDDVGPCLEELWEYENVKGGKICTRMAQKTLQEFLYKGFLRSMHSRWQDRTRYGTRSAFGADLRQRYMRLLEEKMEGFVHKYCEIKEGHGDFLYIDYLPAGVEKRTCSKSFPHLRSSWDYEIGSCNVPLSPTS